MDLPLGAVVAVAVMALTGVVALHGPASLRRPACLLLAVEAVLWLVTSMPEGPTLVHIAHKHGIAVGDLVAGAATAVGVLAWRRAPARTAILDP